MFNPPCSDVCFVPELPARMCLDTGIILIFCSFFSADARLNRPDLN
jgi:hypothetical protein